MNREEALEVLVMGTGIEFTPKQIDYILSDEINERWARQTGKSFALLYSNVIDILSEESQRNLIITNSYQSARMLSTEMLDILDDLNIRHAVRVRSYDITILVQDNLCGFHEIAFMSGKNSNYRGLRCHNVYIDSTEDYNDLYSNVNVLRCSFPITFRTSFKVLN
jgi:hypothetical protein